MKRTNISYVTNKGVELTITIITFALNRNFLHFNLVGGICRGQHGDA